MNSEYEETFSLNNNLESGEEITLTNEVPSESIPLRIKNNFIENILPLSWKSKNNQNRLERCLTNENIKIINDTNISLNKNIEKNLLNNSFDHPNFLNFYKNKYTNFDLGKNISLFENKNNHRNYETNTLYDKNIESSFSSNPTSNYKKEIKIIYTSNYLTKEHLDNLIHNKNDLNNVNINCFKICNYKNIVCNNKVDIPIIDVPFHNKIKIDNNKNDKLKNSFNNNENNLNSNINYINSNSNKNKFKIENEIFNNN